MLCRIEDLSNGDIEVSLQNPADPSLRIIIPSHPCKVQVASVWILTISCQSQSQSSSQLQSQLPSQLQSHSWSLLFSPPSSISEPLSWAPSASQPCLSNTTAVQVYKKVANKVRPVPASLPEDFRIICHIPSDPLITLPVLPPNPPDFTPGVQLTQECLDVLKLNKDGFLWAEELKLLHHMLKVNELGLAWTEAEKGCFCNDYFSPVKIPVIEHVPWAHHNLPIPPGILGDVIQIFKDKFAAGVYEHSDTSYCSH